MSEPSISKTNAIIIEGKDTTETQVLSTILKTEFPNFNWNTITVDLANITEDLIRINAFIRANAIGTIIAYGQEAIFALSITDSLARIIINPCLYPHAELCDYPGINTDALKSVEETTYNYVDGEMRSVTYGIFIGKEVESLYRKDFSKIYGSSNQTIIETTSDEITKKDLTAAFRNGLSYFRTLSQRLSDLDTLNP